MSMHLFPNFLGKRLIIPLAFMVMFSLILAICIPWRGLFANLTATFLGILITICYVEFILREHEKERWAQATALIKRRIDHFAIVSCSNFRAAFNIGSEIIDEGAIDIDDPSSIRREMIRVISRMLPSVNANVHKLTKEDWTKLVPQLQRTWKWADELCQLYGNRIDPELLVLTMRIQNEIEGIVVLHTTFPDVIGVPDDQLPIKKKGSAKVHRNAMENVISSNITNILALASSLLSKLDE